MSAYVDIITGCDYPDCDNEAQRGCEAPFHGDMTNFVQDTRQMSLWEPRAWMHITQYDLDLCYKHWPTGWTQELVAYVNGEQVAR